MLVHTSSLHRARVERSSVPDRDRMKSAEQEHHQDLERRWNKPRPKLSPSPSTSSSRVHSERIRTQSNPTRPDSPITHPKSSSPTPKRPGRHRADPAKSIVPDSGSDQEVEHLRERNWNAVHPKWDAPASPPRAHSPSQAHHARSHSHHLAREANHHATGSNRSLGLHPSDTHSTASSAEPATTPRAGTPGSHPGSVYTERRNFTFPSAPDSGAHSSNKTPASSRFEWQPPLSRAPLPPLELDDSPRPRLPSTEYYARNSSSPTPSPRSLHRTAEPLPVSHIPVKSPKTRETPSTSLVNGSGHAHGETNHKRTAAEIIDIDEILTHLHGEGTSLKSHVELISHFCRDQTVTRIFHHKQRRLSSLLAYLPVHHQGHLRRENARATIKHVSRRLSPHSPSVRTVRLLLPTVQSYRRDVGRHHYAPCPSPPPDLSTEVSRL
jgi:hypothetical protein